MRILITGSRLDVRAGAQLFVRDLARGLQKLGHIVLAYGSDPGQRERFMENDVVPVATDLKNLPFQPDIIHAQHHLDAMTALTALPGVPALFHRYDDVSTEFPPLHPRIYRYLAASEMAAERMTAECSISPSDIDVLFNGVDLGRFQSVRELPAGPARALFFHNRQEQDGGIIAAISEATARLGMQLDFVDPHFDSMMDEPGRFLPSYDIVFASGRLAVEALASGCAVMVLGRNCCGEMVRSENFDRLRRVNFSCAADFSAPAAERIATELRLYSAEDGAAVTRQLLKKADFGPYIDSIVQIYGQVIARHQIAQPDMALEMQAISKYLQQVVPVMIATDDALGRNWMAPSRVGSFNELSMRLSLIEEKLKKMPAVFNQT